MSTSTPPPPTTIAEFGFNCFVSAVPTEPARRKRAAVYKARVQVSHIKPRKSSCEEQFQYAGGASCMFTAQVRPTPLPLSSPATTVAPKRQSEKSARHQQARRDERLRLCETRQEAKLTEHMHVKSGEGMCLS